MERIIKIDGEDVAFRCTAGTARRYRLFFGRDLIVDAQKLVNELSKAKEDAEKAGRDDLRISPDLLVTFENLAYMMAKQADPDLPNTPDEWLDSFEMFSVYEILPQIIDLWLSSFQGIESVKKNRKIQTSHKTKKRGR